ncbi:unnamed protein product [Heterobilharzia americana]|nr:unnamed protein product [Heterobilharzia americana]
MITIRDVKLSVKKMKRWQLEAVRITIYLGVPLFMYGVSGMPKVQEYVYNSNVFSNSHSLPFTQLNGIKLTLQQDHIVPVENTLWLCIVINILSD